MTSDHLSFSSLFACRKTCLAASTSAVDTHATSSTTETSSPTHHGRDNSGISFTSPLMKVYIEDTDAYGIMYNSNYLRSYDRALHLNSRQVRLGTYNDKNDGERDKNTLSASSITVENEGWSILSLGQQKFVSSPLLGEEFVIHATLQQHRDDDINNNMDTEVWDMEMTSPDGTIVYNSIKDLLIAKSPQLVNHVPPVLLTSATAESLPTFLDIFTIYRDEVDAHWTGHLPLRNVLKLFERARTNALGGPQTGLFRLQHENGILVVVTKIEECTLINSIARDDEDDDNNDNNNDLCYAGQQVHVETKVKIKRKGMIIECFQTLVTDGTNTSSQDDHHLGRRRRPLAQGKVTMMMLDATTKRPTSKLPEWLLNKFTTLNQP